MTPPTGQTRTVDRQILTEPSSAGKLEQNTCSVQHSYMLDNDRKCLYDAYKNKKAVLVAQCAPLDFGIVWVRFLFS